MPVEWLVHSGVAQRIEFFGTQLCCGRTTLACQDDMCKEKLRTVGRTRFRTTRTGGTADSAVSLLTRASISRRQASAASNSGCAANAAAACRPSKTVAQAAASCALAKSDSCTSDKVGTRGQRMIASLHAASAVCIVMGTRGAQRTEEKGVCEGLARRTEIRLAASSRP